MPAIRTPEAKARLAPGGLRLTFSRDLAGKYRPDSRGQGDGEKLKRVLEAVETWRVAGYYDFLQIRRFGCLERLEDVSQAEERDSSWRSFSDLVLVPLTEFPVDKSFVERLEEPNRDWPTPDPMLVVIKIVLNPAIFEFGASPDSALEALGNAIRLLGQWMEGEREREVDGRAKAGDFPVGYFASLSGPDLAVIALPRTPTQLWLMHRLVRRVRTLLLSEIADAIARVPSEAAAGAMLPGHACASVEPSLAFNTHALSCFQDQEFVAEEQSTGLRLAFRVRSDCGHEDEVIKAIKEHCKHPVIVPAFEAEHDGRLKTSWSNYAVEGHFRSLADFVTACNSLWFAGPNGAGESSWREKHLIHSMTPASFLTSRWTIAPQPKSILNAYGYLTETFSTDLTVLSRTSRRFPGHSSTNRNEWNSCRST